MWDYLVIFSFYYCIVCYYCLYLIYIYILLWDYLFIDVARASMKVDTAKSGEKESEEGIYL